MSDNPNKVQEIITWFKNYKALEGKEPGVFLNNERVCHKVTQIALWC